VTNIKRLLKDVSSLNRLTILAKKETVSIIIPINCGTEANLNV